jgi:hypothetical protein
VLAAAGAAAAQNASPVGNADVRLVAIAPGADGEARAAIAIGAGGEVYEPASRSGDAAGWVHKLPCSTASQLVAAGRAGAEIVAIGDGVVYRLAANGWSAIRLTQHGKAVLGTGEPAVAAVGRQLFALDRMTNGEPTKLVQAPGNVIAIGAGAKAIVVATEAGAFRLAATGRGAGKLIALPGVPAHPRLIGDRWAINENGAVDLVSQARISWPSGLVIGPATEATDEALIAVGQSRDGLELLTLRQGKLSREPIRAAAAPAAGTGTGSAIDSPASIDSAGGTAVGVVADRTGGIAVALADGHIWVRGRTGWSVAQISEAMSTAHPGPPPATSR